MTVTRKIKIIYLIASLFIVASKTDAQTTTPKYLTYKGIPLTGTVIHFSNELENKGFEAVYFENQETPRCHKGMFAGYKSTVKILCTPLSNTVYGTVTQLEDHVLWRDIQMDFDIFKNNLIAVYGKPALLKEEFIAPYIKDDGYSMKALSEDKVNYIAVWELQNGTIAIRITHLRQGYGLVQIEYIDKVNEALRNEEQTTIIRNDL